MKWVHICYQTIPGPPGVRRNLNITANFRYEINVTLLLHSSFQIALCLQFTLRTLQDSDQMKLKFVSCTCNFFGTTDINFIYGIVVY